MPVLVSPRSPLTSIPRSIAMPHRNVTVTTSWDDGHPLDLRVAELMLKHGLCGTFYIPRSSPYSRMSKSEMVELSQYFEIGAHTLNHVNLTREGSRRAWQEIIGSKMWVEDTCGKPCVVFCPPGGRFGARHLEMATRAGYSGIRTVEMMSLSFPKRCGPLRILPTTIQAHSHGLAPLLRNSLKRFRISGVLRSLRLSVLPQWPRQAEVLFGAALGCGGVFHLWGHSWELEDDEWKALDEIFGRLSVLAQANYLSNGALCALSPEGISS